MKSLYSLNDFIGDILITLRPLNINFWLIFFEVINRTESQIILSLDTFKACIVSFIFVSATDTKDNVFFQKNIHLLMYSITTK